MTMTLVLNDWKNWCQLHQIFLPAEIEIDLVHYEYEIYKRYFNCLKYRDEDDGVNPQRLADSMLHAEIFSSMNESLNFVNKLKAESGGSGLLVTYTDILQATQSGNNYKRTKIRSYIKYIASSEISRNTISMSPTDTSRLQFSSSLTDSEKKSLIEDVTEKDAQIVHDRAGKHFYRQTLHSGRRALSKLFSRKITSEISENPPISITLSKSHEDEVVFKQVNDDIYFPSLSKSSSYPGNDDSSSNNIPAVKVKHTTIKFYSPTRFLYLKGSLCKVACDAPYGEEIPKNG